MERETTRELAELDRAIELGMFEEADAILADLRTRPELAVAVEQRVARLAVFRVPEAPRPPMEYATDPEALRGVLRGVPIYFLWILGKLAVLGVYILARTLSMKLRTYGIVASAETCFGVLIAIPIFLALRVGISRWLLRRHLALGMG